MNKEITVVVIIDTTSAIKENSLEGNLYMIDDVPTSKGKGTPNLITDVTGEYWPADNSQAGEYLINWLVYPIQSLPSTLPRTFFADRVNQKKKEILNHVHQSLEGSNNKSKPKEVKQTLSNFNHLFSPSGTTDQSSTNQKTIHSTESFLDLKGNLIHHTDLKKDQDEHNETIVHTPAQVFEISGEAVDKHVLFPAQYGTPAIAKDGWYWCASTSVSKEGTFKYTMHVNLYNPPKKQGEPWEIVKLTHDSTLKIVRNAMKNGFNNAGYVSDLPIL